MHRDIPLPTGTAFRWVDLVNPKQEDVQTLSGAYGLTPAIVRDFLNQPHLPKIETFPDGLLVIVRAFDDGAKGGDTYQALTRRLVIFLREDVVFTVRRREQAYAAAVLERIAGQADQALPREKLLGLLLGAAIHTYTEPLRKAEEALDRIEEALLEGHRPPGDMGRIYRIKRLCAVIRRVLGRTVLLLKELRNSMPDEGGYFSDIQEEADRLQAWADELQEGATHLLNLQLNLQGQRTNEVMRVLTVFSAFFLPLTFIAGVYGMNFQNMPELKQPHGYYWTWAAMGGVVVAIVFWFRKKGWMK